ncbi:hypothetical protein ABBQ38_000570 [Trebouxia sp. C0009 RCD-2024]
MAAATQPAAPHDAEEYQQQIDNIFSLKRPRDIRAGLASGGKSALKGIAAGTVGLLAAPIVGAYTDGLKGFGQGIAAGVAGAVILPVAGLGVGVAQVIRGAANTPEAIKESRQGRYWDQDQREWTDRPSLAMVVDDTSYDPMRERWDQQRRDAGAFGDVVDYYGLLGVPKTAASEEIKKQYYLLARKLHPDKNPDDPLAKDRFQKLGEAYQVLSNADLRAKYDAHGVEGLDVNFMDTAEFFSMLFGSESFDHLLGELSLARMTRSGEQATAGQQDKMQMIREEKLAANLKALLRRWVEGDQTGFRESMEEEGRNLAKASFGPTILLAIGKAYEGQAAIYLGGFFQGSLVSLRQEGHSIKSKVHLAQMGLKVFQAQQKLEQMDKDQKQRSEAKARMNQQSSSPSAAPATGPFDQQPGSSAEQPLSEQQRAEAEAASTAAEALEHAQLRAQLEEATLPLMLDAMWAANVLDIESTLRHVCKKVLSEATATKQTRKARAQGLQVLGQIFQKAALAANANAPQAPRDAKQQIEDAMMAVMEKRHAMDDAAHGQSSNGHAV